MVALAEHVMRDDFVSILVELHDIDLTDVRGNFEDTFH